MMFDVKLHAPAGTVSWTDDYANVWDAIEEAHNRAKASGADEEVFAVVATRSATGGRTWTCAACHRPGLPEHLVACDACGVQRGRDAPGPSPFG